MNQMQAMAMTTGISPQIPLTPQILLPGTQTGTDAFTDGFRALFEQLTALLVTPGEPQGTKTEELFPGTCPANAFPQNETKQSPDRLELAAALCGLQIPPDAVLSAEPDAVMQLKISEVPLPENFGTKETPDAQPPVSPAKNGVFQQTAETPVRKEASPEQTRPVSAVTPNRVQTDRREPETFTAAYQPHRLFPEDTEIPVRVADAPSLDTESPDLAKDLAARIRTTIGTGGTHVEIRLSPQSLGTVLVDISRDETGTLRVTLSTNSERAHTILDQHTSSLQTLLSGPGQTDRTEVYVRQAEENREAFYDRSGGNGERQNEKRRQPRQDTREAVSGEDFLQQMRLGLISPAGAASAISL